MTFQLFVNSFSYIFSRELWFSQIRLFSTMISWYFRKSALPQRGSVDLKRYIHYCRLYLIELSKDAKFIYLFVIDVFLIEIMLMITLFSFLWVPNPFYHTLWSIPYLLCSHFSYRLVLVGLSKKEFLFFRFVCHLSLLCTWNLFIIPPPAFCISSNKYCTSRF